MKQVILEANSSIAQSGDRTQRVHDEIIQYISDLIPNFEDNYYAETEIPFKDAVNKTGKMKVDIVIFDKETNKPILLFPVKAPISNYAQNAGNNANTSIAETARLKRFHPDVKILFTMVLGNTVPYYKGGGIFKKWEQDRYIDLTDFLSVFDGVSFARVSFDVETSKAPNKEEFMASFNNDTISNIDTTEFDAKVKSILNK